MQEVTRILIKKGITNPRKLHNYKSDMKICSMCVGEFPRTNEYFRKESKRKDGLSYLCKKCAAKVCAEYSKKNITKTKAYQKSPEFVFSQLKYQAKKRNIMFSLDFSFYLEKLAFSPCVYCGETKTKHWIDRKNNDHSVGYTKENSVPCCELCNKAKAHRDVSDFINHCKRVALYN